jgi:hypothetical protein
MRPPRYIVQVKIFSETDDEDMHRSKIMDIEVAAVTPTIAMDKAIAFIMVERGPREDKK